MGNLMTNVRIKSEKTHVSNTLLLKIESLRGRANALTGLRKMLAFKPHQDILPEQWEVLETQLAVVANKILQNLRIYADKYFSERDEPTVRQTLINRLGEIELELTNAYSFFDTYMDILTQRLSNDIGPMLKGCDAIAADALKRGFLADITVPPLVYCERGYGASTLRQGVHIQRGVPNPIPFIAIPYARMNEKYNLMSINHEVGHQALAKLNMVNLVQRAVKQCLSKAGASPLIQGLFANWSRELVPDFWGFCLSGMAQTASVRDVLILPTPMMFSVSLGQPHPPSYLRFLMSVAWCRQLWGKGDWDDWETEWLLLYPLDTLDEPTRAIIEEAQKWIPTVSKILIKTKFKKLGNQPLTSLFDLTIIAPNVLKKYANSAGILSEEFKQLPIGVQLGVFRLLREKRQMKLADINALMDGWLKGLK
jgi:hypothetical protein